MAKELMTKVKELLELGGLPEETVKAVTEKLISEKVELKLESEVEKDEEKDDEKVEEAAEVVTEEKGLAVKHEEEDDEDEKEAPVDPNTNVGGYDAVKEAEEVSEGKCEKCEKEDCECDKEEDDEVKEEDIIQLDSNTWKIAGICDIDLVSETLGIDLPVEAYLGYTRSGSSVKGQIGLFIRQPFIRSFSKNYIEIHIGSYIHFKISGLVSRIIRNIYLRLIEDDLIFKSILNDCKVSFFLSIKFLDTH